MLTLQARTYLQTRFLNRRLAINQLLLAGMPKNHALILCADKPHVAFCDAVRYDPLAALACMPKRDLELVLKYLPELEGDVREATPEFLLGYVTRSFLGVAPQPPWSSPVAIRTVICEFILNTVQSALFNETEPDHGGVYIESTKPEAADDPEDMADMALTVAVKSGYVIETKPLTAAFDGAPVEAQMLKINLRTGEIERNIIIIQ